MGEETENHLDNDDFDEQKGQDEESVEIVDEGDSWESENPKPRKPFPVAFHFLVEVIDPFQGKGVFRKLEYFGDPVRNVILAIQQVHHDLVNVPCEVRDCVDQQKAIHKTQIPEVEETEDEIGGEGWADYLIHFVDDLRHGLRNRQDILDNCLFSGADDVEIDALVINIDLEFQELLELFGIIDNQFDRA